MFEKIKKLLVDELQVSGDITEDSALAELGVNSLELADLVMHCEEEFGVEISDDDIRTFITVGDLVRFLESKQRQMCIRDRFCSDRKEGMYHVRGE